MKLAYKDTIILVDPVVNNFGSEKIGRQETVKCLLGPSRGFGHSANQDAIDADLIAYIDPEDVFVLEKDYRLEGMLAITSLGEASTDAWYRITTVNIGRKNLTSNAVDNIQCNLSKSSPIQGVS